MPLEHPATTISKAAAPAKPSRVRKRLANGRETRSSRAKAARTIWRGETGGRVLEGGGTTKLCVAIVTFPVPGAVTGPGAVQEPWGIDPLQDKLTEPVNPPTPATATAMVPVEPGLTVTG